MRTPIWRLIGLTGSQYGELQILNGRLKYSPASGVGFDVELTEVKDINFPWHYFSGGFKMTLAGEEFRNSSNGLLRLWTTIFTRTRRLIQLS